jgi:hypothetical protein
VCSPVSDIERLRESGGDRARHIVHFELAVVSKHCPHGPYVLVGQATAAMFGWRRLSKPFNQTLVFVAFRFATKMADHAPWISRVRK